MPAAPQLMSFEVSDARVSEGSSPYGQFLEFTVSLDKPAERFVILSFRTRDVTARAASYDYYSHSHTLTFFYGQQEKEVRCTCRRTTARPRERRRWSWRSTGREARR